jgi:hypothetical protein
MTQDRGNAALDFEPYRQNYPASTPTKALDLNLNRGACTIDLLLCQFHKIPLRFRVR